MWVRSLSWEGPLKKGMTTHFNSLAWRIPGTEEIGGPQFMASQSETQLMQQQARKNFSSVQFSRSVVSDSLRPHEPQHARPPCPSPTARVYRSYMVRINLYSSLKWILPNMAMLDKIV